jgi:hypothetical protein
VKNKTKIIGLLLVLTTLIFSAYYFLSFGRSTSIDNSLVELSNTQKFSKYTVNKTVKITETDSSGEWWLTLDQEFGSEMLAADQYLEADAADTTYIIDSFSQKLNPDIKKTGGYVLYRGETAMSKNTICTPAPCNVYILAKLGEKNLYLGIYKN